MLKNIRRTPPPVSNQPKPEPLDLPVSSGVVYIAFGKLAIQACRTSLQSLRKIHPQGLKVATISEQPIEGADIHIQQQEKDIGAREFKTYLYQYTPFEWTLYLDADTVVVGPLGAGFYALEKGWHMAAALDYRPTVSQIDHIPAEDVQATMQTLGTGDYPHLNTGMLFFRKCWEVNKFYDAWYQEWQKFHYRDQAAFVRALHQSDVKLWVLPWQWNTHRRDKALHILHEHHAVDRTWRGGLP